MKAIASVIRFVLALAACANVVAQAPAAPGPDTTTVQQVRSGLIPEQRLKEVLSLVEREYFRPLAPETLGAVARERTFEPLDPYSKYFDPETLSEFNRELHGSFGGIGIAFDDSPTSEGWRVKGPCFGSPALAAGVRAGDVVVAVDGRPTKGRSLDDVRAAMRGPVGATVTIEVRRADHPDGQRFSIHRAAISTPSVFGVHRDSAGVWDFMLTTGGAAYLRIAWFSETTVADFDIALKDIEKEDPTSLVLDLRANSGGLADAAIAIADRLLDAGRIVTFKTRNKTETFDATPGATFSRPVAVLVSPSTISAAEILCAALQDNHRVAVIGARTYGKGMVQEILPLAGSGDAVKLTIAVYERPSGAPIERHASGGSPEFGGVWPDPGLTIPASDQQWTTWDDALLESDVRANLVVDPSLNAQSEDDPALEKALEVLAADRVTPAAIGPIGGKD